MYKHKITTFFIAILVLSACKSNTEVDVKEPEIVKEIVDTLQQDTVQDSIPEEHALVVDMTSAIDKDGYVDVEKEHLQSISKKTPQMEFCTCIVRIDSMEKELGVLEGEKWDQLWADYEKLTEKCKVV